MRGFRVNIALLLTLMSALLTSCEYKELCYDHEPHALRYHLELATDYRLDWEDEGNSTKAWESNWPEELIPYDELRPEKPSGLRVLTYSATGSEPQKQNIAPEGGIVYLNPGVNDILMYNNDTESIVFADLDNNATTRATTRTRTRSTYLGNTYSGVSKGQERTVNQPDMLWGAFIKEYNAEKVIVPERYEVTLQPLVYTYVICVKISEGLEYVKDARGALAGVAGSVYLNTGYTSSDAVTVFFDCEMTDYGCVAYVRSFGIPNYPANDYVNPGSRGDEQKYALNLELRLANDKYLSLDFDVTSQLGRQPHGGVIVQDGIVVKREDAVTSGGFDVDVDDWEEEVNVSIPL